MSTSAMIPVSRHSSGSPPEDLRHFINFFEGQQSGRERFRWALRDSLDELFDGQRTGRWCYQHLSKTEKTHLGTVIEVNLTKEFDITNGHHLDWQIDNEDLDCKFSKDLGGWEIPMEMYACAEHQGRSGIADHPALLVWLNDDTKVWAAGLLRITDARLAWRRPTADTNPQRAYNRDNKRKIAKEAWPEIYWLWGGVQLDLPENTLLFLEDDVRDRVLGGQRSGQSRVNALFREVRGKIVRRTTVLTVGQQADAPKRVRDARLHLKSSGHIVLGHQESHPQLAKELGLPVPHKGEWVSARLAEVAAEDSRPKVYIDRTWWAVANDGDPVRTAPTAPKLLPEQPSR